MAFPPTPRLINDIRILKPRHDIVMRTRIGQTVPSKQTTDDKYNGQTQRYRNSGHTPTAANVRDHVADMSQTAVERSEHPAHYTAPRPSEPHLTEDDSEAVYVVALIGDGEVALLGRNISFGARRLFENGEAVGVGKTEIDKFHLTTVTGNHDI